jgi:ATP-dependent 26S proteasome regulatory subunit
MDGLKQDADILFILTTSRPEQLESALAGRPGRIDQAIEVPLPDDIGRKKLVQLYGTGLPLGDAVVNEAAQRTEGVSAAFIKELMRRVAQASIARDGGTTVESADIGEALDDMLFTGGKLNVKLLICLHCSPLLPPWYTRGIHLADRRLFYFSRDKAPTEIEGGASADRWRF